MSDNFQGSRIFLNIPVFAINKYLLKRPKSLLLLGHIVSMLNTTGKFFMSNKTIAKKLDCTVQAVNNYLQALEEEQLIVRTKVYAEDSNAIIGRKIEAGPALLNASLLGLPTQNDEGYQPEFNTLTNSSLHKERSLREQSKREVNRDISATTNYTAKVKKVIEYLNKKTGKSFKPNAKGNRNAIIPRLKEGYTVDQLKKVIDNKVADWKGVTFSNGQPGDNYLTPTTLFRSSKIEGYLNEVHKPSKPLGVETDQERIKRLAAQYPS